MLVHTDRGAIATDAHVGLLGGDTVEHDDRAVEVTGALADELRGELAAGGSSLRDVEEGGPACVPSLRAAVLLRWTRERATVQHLDGDPGLAVPVPPARPGIVY